MDNNLPWHVSSHSTGNGACIEVAQTNTAAFFRDTKDRGIPAAAVAPASWGAFVDAVKVGALGA